MKKEQEYEYDKVDLPKEKKKKEKKEKVSLSTYKTDVGEREIGFFQDNGLETVKEMIKEMITYDQQHAKKERIDNNY